MYFLDEAAEAEQVELRVHISYQVIYWITYHTNPQSFVVKYGVFPRVFRIINIWTF